ncbi:MAG: transcriptional regulator [Bradyrhizobiaceae bacterium]|nr:transcriptional regulator [Bradyrhizobiaceae bacterium]
MLNSSRYLRFDEFRFCVPSRELLRIGEDGSVTSISLGSRASDLLLLFLRRPGELVTKTEIMEAVWPNVAVEESNLTVQISALRRALGRSGGRAIQTVPGRGYRFTLLVSEDGGTAIDVPPSRSHDPSASRPEGGQSAPAQSVGPTARWRLVATTTATTLLCAGAVFVALQSLFSDHLGELAAGRHATTGGNTFSSEAVPFVADEGRQALAGYHTLPDSKAVAISRHGLGIASGARDIDAAKEEALQRCATLARRTTGDPGPCAVYAAGSEVVWPKDRLRLPWPADIHATPLDVPFTADLPTIPPFRRSFIDQRYRAGALHKALAIGQERFYSFRSRSTQAEAVRLAIEACSDYVQAPCLLVAVDDFLTVQIPKLRPVTQLFLLAEETEISDAEKQRIAATYQRHDWRALARGGRDNWYAIADAPSEAAAIDRAMQLCAARDHDCQIYAIGNFRVGDQW